GHFASLMSMIGRGCYRAIKTGAESLTAGLLDEVRIDQAAEDARGQLQAAIATGQLPSRPDTGTSASAAGEAMAV
ncbi:MAG TPA: AAA family ATPase, partial [Actinobacteria bacterium]|nr:AAA family ATPase [Actinomycetota bacterium]